MKVDRKTLTIGGSAAVVIAALGAVGGIALASPKHDQPAQREVIQQVAATPSTSTSVAVPSASTSVTVARRAVVQPAPVTSSTQEVVTVTEPVQADPTVINTLPTQQGTIGDDGITRAPAPPVITSPTPVPNPAGVPSDPRITPIDPPTTG